MIDHKRKLLFIHIARTGGTSIEFALVGDDWWNISPETKHISAKQAKDIYGEEVWNTYTKFSVVRNPWDRLASMWSTRWWHQASSLREDCSFETFLKSLRPHPHEKYNTLFYHDILNDDIDFIIRFETLKKDFTSMLKSIGVGGEALPHVEKRNHKHYSVLYNETEKQLVYEIFYADIVKFNYYF